MNTSVTSKEAILSTCRELVSDKGLSALNMRGVAEACNVALGSIYYYFPSKDDLLIATIESVWEDIFRWKDKELKGLSFIEYIDKCFKYIENGMEKYPHFFTIHSISFSAKSRGKAHNSMEAYISQIKLQMVKALKEDVKVKEDAFSGRLKELELVDFVLANIVCLLIQKKKDCLVLLEVIRRTIY